MTAQENTTGGTGPSVVPARILVVDDQAKNRELLRAYLESAGYQVLTTGSGKEALAAVDADRPDLILLDVMMPGMNGYEVCQRLKSGEETAFIPIIMLTALQEFEHRLRGIEVGADEFLTKPFNQLELLTRVRSLLRTKGLHDQVAAYNRLLEEKVAERTAALERALADLREMDRLKSEFLANISHELLTPLTPIKGYLPALLQGELGSLTPKQQQGLGIIAQSVDRLHRLIDDLLTFMQWESGQAGLRLEPVDVKALIEACVIAAAPLAQAKGVQVTSQVSPGVPKIRADAAALGRALAHLLDNAVKFTPNGGTITVRAQRVPAILDFKLQIADLKDREPALQSQISNLSTEIGDFLEIAVEDTGVGIPAEATHRIFDHFYQVDSSSTRQHGGTGLGLAIVKRILDAHGALIGVESRPGQGATFLIRLPVAT